MHFVLYIFLGVAVVSCFLASPHSIFEVKQFEDTVSVDGEKEYHYFKSGKLRPLASLSPIASRFDFFNYTLDGTKIHPAKFYGPVKCGRDDLDSLNGTSGRIKLMEIEGAGVNGYGMFVKDGKYYAQVEACHQQHADEEKKRIDFPDNEILMFGHDYSHCYGHWTHETFARIFAFPRDLVLRCKIVLPMETDFSRHFFGRYGVKQENIVVADSETYVYGKKIHYVDTPDCCLSHPYLIQKTREWIFNTHNVSSKPYRCVIHQRPKSRRLENADELLELFKEKFPDCQWEKHNEPSGWDARIKYWSEIKLFFGFHGGVLTNIAYMKPGTIVINIHSSICSTCFYWPAVYGGLRFYEYYDPRVSHFKKRGYVEDPNTMISIVNESFRDFNGECE